MVHIFRSFLALCSLYVALSVTPSSQKSALQSFYNACGGNGWDFTEISSEITYLGRASTLIGIAWDFSQDPCDDSFTGISCSASDSIEMLWVPGANMTCNLETDVVDNIRTALTDLTELNLADNRLSGVIPLTLTDFNDISYINLDENLIVGTIPIDITTLSGINFLHLRRNSLTGTIPDNIGILNKIRNLEFEQNFLEGTLPSSIGNMTEIQVLKLEKNSFVGTIPDEYADLHNLENFDLDSNSLSGTIPSFMGDFPNMTLFDVSSNNMHGTIPDKFKGMVKLVNLLLNENHFSTDESHEYFLDFLDTTVQTNLKVIDVSHNDFTKKISPTIFKSETLHTFVAAANCFDYGALPENICEATSLRYLVVSGLSSGVACRQYFSDLSFFDGFTVQVLAEGTLPSCVYNLPDLKVLYASGNGLHGNLGETLSNNLTSVDLSLNRLTGTIPEAFVNANLSLLDLENNKLGGTLDVFNRMEPEQNPDLRLSVNHISGVLPDTLLKLTHLDILIGNVFGCPKTGADIDAYPVNDPNRGRYSCGSEALNTAIYLFIAAFCLLSLMVTLLFLRGFTILQAFQNSAKQLVVWISLSEGHVQDTESRDDTDDDGTSGVSAKKGKISLTHILKISNIYKSMRLFTVCMGLFIFILLMLVYPSLWASGHGFLTYPYSWVITAGFLTGFDAMMVLLFFWTIIFLLIRILGLTAKLTLSKDKQMAESKAAQDRKDKFSDMTWKDVSIAGLRYFCILLLSLSVVIVFNALYIYVLLDKGSTAKTLTRFALIYFNYLWTFYVVPWALDTDLLYFGLTSQQVDIFDNKCFGGRIVALFLLNSLNLLLVPVFTAAFSDPSCFYGALFAKPETHSSYLVEECEVYNSFNNQCLRYAEVDYSQIFEVPFVYNFSCGTAVMEAYVPNFTYTYGIQIIYNLIQFCILFRIKSPVYHSTIQEGENYGVERGGQNEDESENEDKRPSIRSANQSVDKTDKDKDGEVEDKGCCLNWLVSEPWTCLIPYQRIVWDYRQRHKDFLARGYPLSNDENIYDMLDLNEILSSQMNNLCVMLTYGILSPMLTLTIVFKIITETYYQQSLIGIFLENEYRTICLYDFVKGKDKSSQNGVKPDEIPASTFDSQTGKVVSNTAIKKKSVAHKMARNSVIAQTDLPITSSLSHACADLRNVACGAQSDPVDFLKEFRANEDSFDNLTEGEDFVKMGFSTNDVNAVNAIHKIWGAFDALHAADAHFRRIPAATFFLGRKIFLCYMVFCLSLFLYDVYGSAVGYESAVWIPPTIFGMVVALEVVFYIIKKGYRKGEDVSGDSDDKKVVEESAVANPVDGRRTSRLTTNPLHEDL
jgi:Leucine-rich repeat (LRR) protein